MPREQVRSRRQRGACRARHSPGVMPAHLPSSSALGVVIAVRGNHSAGPVHPKDEP